LLQDENHAADSAGRGGLDTIGRMIEEWAGPVSVEEMYGEWDYEAAVEVLGRSLDPRPRTSLMDTIDSLGLDESNFVLDIGGREGRDCLTIAERFGARCMSVDPVAANMKRGREIAAGHEYGHLVDLELGVIEDIPAPDGHFDLVLSRDMLGHIGDLDGALAECSRVLTAGGAMVIHEVFATPLMEPRESAMLCAYTASVPDRMSVAVFETAVAAAGFSIESLDMVGSEWVEASQEAGTVPNYLLQVARLRRARDQLVADLGEVPYRVMYGNALWSIYQLIGKLESRVYVLRRSEQ